MYTLFQNTLVGMFRCFAAFVLEGVPLVGMLAACFMLLAILRVFISLEVSGSSDKSSGGKQKGYYEK